MTKPDDADLAGLAELARVPEPRRTDDAFARSVADGVARARAPRWLFLPAVAAGAAAVTFAIVHEPRVDTVDAGTIARVEPTAPAEIDRVQDDDSDDDEDDDAWLISSRDDFALPSLDGSDEQELLALEAKLDEALKKL
jgi:hypothetical protein